MSRLFGESKLAPISPNSTRQVINVYGSPGQRSTGQFLTQSVADSRYAAAAHTHTTAQVAETTNLYFTTARAQAAITGTGPISVNAGVVSISNISDAHIVSNASIAWSKISKAGASPSDVGALSATGTAINSLALGGVVADKFVQGNGEGWGTRTTELASA